MRVNHTEIRTFIQRFNGSSGGFRYGFWVFRAFSAWFSGWFGEMCNGVGAGFRGGSPPSPILRPCGFLGISLQFLRTRVIHVIAVITAQGERTMNGIPAETANTAAGAPAEQPRPAQKPRSEIGRASC